MVRHIIIIIIIAFVEKSEIEFWKERKQIEKNMRVEKKFETNPEGIFCFFSFTFYILKPGDK